MDEHASAAQTIVETHVWYAAGAGLVPIPFLDMAAIAAIELKMIKELSEVYGVDFIEERGKAVVAALMGGVGSGMIANSGTVLTVLKAIPLVGQAIASISMPIFGGAVTYAAGRVFIQHFASGGTLLTFDPQKARAFFRDQYEKGKRVVLRRPAAAEPQATPA